jgi:beta-galactosidase/beta-glucuronidase
MQWDPPLEDPWSRHPRPQLQRPWADLSGEWRFRYDDDSVGRDDHWYADGEAFELQIVVPFAPETKLSGIGDDSFHPVVWYSRDFWCRPGPGRRVVLHFAAVDYRASVWVNEQLVTEHEGGHTPFWVDVTEVLDASGQQQIVVRAEDHADDLGQPRGKQDWRLEPHGIWYRRTTGIWQPVWLEEVPATRIESLHWTPDTERATMGLAVRLNQLQQGLRLRVRLRFGDGTLIDDEYAVQGRDLRRELGLDKAAMTLEPAELLWTPEHPNLIDAELELLDQAGVIDRVVSYTALRSVNTASGRFQLNGKPYFLRLVLEQGFWPESHLTPPSEEALERELTLVKQLGFNGVRLHQKVGDSRFLYWCDRLGVLVWSELPAAYEFSAQTIGRLTREWMEVQERDRSHPCIIAWVPFNESWGVPQLSTSEAQRDLVRALYHLTKSLDPTRPVIGNDGWEQVLTDIITVHDYSSRGDTLRERYGSYAAVEETLRHVQPSYRSVLLSGLAVEERPVMVTEFGGITLAREGGALWNGYGAVRTADDLIDRYRSLVDALLDSPSLAGFCYTQLTDTLQEQNGLLTGQRVPKALPEKIRAINHRTAASVPADEINQFQFGDYPTPLDERVDQQSRGVGIPD